nr:protein DETOXIFICATION 43-like [Ipomoea batatas]
MLLFLVVFYQARKVFKWDDLGREILQMAIPAALALAADPVASLIDTAFIGHLGPVEIAAVGVAASIINQANKVTIFPLVNITTSFVAEETTVKEVNNNNELSARGDDLSEGGNVQIDSGEEGSEEETGESDENSEAETMGSGYMGSSDTNGSPSISEITEISLQIYVEENVSPVETNVNERAYGEVQRGRLRVPSASTALIMGLILGLLQTVFLTLLARPLLGLMGVKSGSAMLQSALKYLVLRSIGSPAVLLSLAIQGIFRGLKDTTTPLYATGNGAAIAHVISQYIMVLILFCKLIKEVELLPPSSRHLQLSKFLRNGLWLFARVIAATFCVTLASSLAARLGSTVMAAFQAIIAGAIAQKDYSKARATAARVLQMGIILGHALVVFVGVGLYFGKGAFSADKNVLRMITIGVPFVAGTQPINTMAFVLDGVNFGASDFLYAAYSMVFVAAMTVGSEFLLLKSNGFVGIWIALAIFMLLRTIAGFWRMGTGTGPWRFLRALDT